MALTVDYNQHSVLLKLSLCPEINPADWGETSVYHRISVVCRTVGLKLCRLRFLPVVLWRLWHHFRNVALGCFIMFLILTLVIERPAQEVISVTKRNEYQHKNHTKMKISVSDAERQWLYVGVLSAGQFLEERTQHIWRTWGHRVPKLEMFTGISGVDPRGLPVVQLPGIDETEYPPQHKSFAMLQYICVHHVDDFDWFLRADDDVYVKVHQLRSLLNTMESVEPVYMGQSGYGRTADRGQLGLDGHSFCMGGPGVIISRSAMKGLCRYIKRCQDEVVSAEEDVEIGRCFIRHLGMQCTRAKQNRQLFFHSFIEQHSKDFYLRDLSSNPDFETALTLHPAKKPEEMWNLNFYHLINKAHKLNNRISSLEHQLTRLHEVTEATVLSSNLETLLQVNSEPDHDKKQKFCSEDFKMESHSGVFINRTHVCLPDKSCILSTEWVSFQDKIFKTVLEHHPTVDIDTIPLESVFDFSKSSILYRFLLNTNERSSLGSLCGFMTFRPQPLSDL